MFSFLCLCLSVCLSEVAPYLRGGGVRQQVVLEGNRLVLTCLAGGSWPLQYRWTLNNSNITNWTPQYRSVVTDWLCGWHFLMNVYVLEMHVGLFVYLTSFLLSVFPSGNLLLFSHACSMENSCP